MKKIIFISVICIIASITTSCQRQQEPERFQAKLCVPLISKQSDGTFRYTLPIRHRSVTCRQTEIDFARTLEGPTPKLRVTVQTDGDSAIVSFHAPLEVILSDMDSLCFMYPQEAERFDLPTDIYLLKDQTPALSDNFYVLAYKGGEKKLYTREGKEADIALETLRNEPAD